MCLMNGMRGRILWWIIIIIIIGHAPKWGRLSGPVVRPVPQDQTLPIAKDWGISVWTFAAHAFFYTIVTFAELLRS